MSGGHTAICMAMDAAQFRGLVEEHQRMVFSIALRVTGDHGLAEEVAQDAFLELFRNTQGFESDDHRRFWLRRVTVHRATDAIRRRRRQPESGAEEMDDGTAAGEDFAADALDLLMQQAVAARLAELLQVLPEAMRVALVLRYQEEMTPPEIAAALNQPLATVKSNLARGLKLMRQKAHVMLKEYR